jgi:uncharacterized protein (DUF1015 family)
MAEIAPFKGILYDPRKVDVSKVIAPPYDVISDDDKKALEALDPHNVVRLILPGGDYDGAAKTFQAWQGEGVLARAQRAAIYRYTQTFTVAALGARKFVRRGIIAAVRLHAYDENVILPHERTLRGPKEDRLKLMRAARAHFSQIFGLYRDPSLAIEEMFGSLDASRGHLEGTTADGTLHKLWRVEDRETIANVAKKLGALKFYIADGHHRYETMLALRDEFRKNANPGSRASTEYATFFLTNIDDPGLVILPTHRLVHSLASFDREKVFAAAKKWFAIRVLPGKAKDATAVHEIIADGSRISPSFAVVVPGSDDVWLLSMNGDPAEAGLTGHRSVINLDVTILHGLFLEKVLGIDREAQEQQKNLRYAKDTQQALDEVAKGGAQLGVLMNPTRVDQVLAVADARETMPQKSTFFVPKLASGLVINPIDPDEDLDRAL